MTIEIYDMPTDVAATGYCLFPPALEDNPLVLFHATPIANYDAIVADGFKIPNPGGTGSTGLASVSFAKRSSAALTHAMEMRKKIPGDYGVFAVKYLTLDRKGIANNLSDIHDFTLDPAPEIIGYCTVPASYRHL